MPSTPKSRVVRKDVSTEPLRDKEDSLVIPFTPEVALEFLYAEHAIRVAEFQRSPWERGALGRAACGKWMAHPLRLAMKLVGIEEVPRFERLRWLGTRDRLRAAVWDPVHTDEEMQKLHADIDRMMAKYLEGL